jgi:hypothetical protein
MFVPQRHVLVAFSFCSTLAKKALSSNSLGSYGHLVEADEDQGPDL